MSETPLPSTLDVPAPAPVSLGATLMCEHCGLHDAICRHRPRGAAARRQSFHDLLLDGSELGSLAFAAQQQTGHLPGISEQIGGAGTS